MTFLLTYNLFKALNSIGGKIKDAGGSYKSSSIGDNAVFDFFHHKKTGMLRVYTTANDTDLSLEPCDGDALFIVQGHMRGNQFFPITKPRKILRTAPNNIPEKDRPQACIDRLIQAIRESYARMGDTPSCPKCGESMTLRVNKKNKSRFFGCIDFPKCKGTKAA